MGYPGYSRIVPHGLEDRIVELDGAGDEKSRVRSLRGHDGLFLVFVL